MTKSFLVLIILCSCLGPTGSIATAQDAAAPPPPEIPPSSAVQYPAVRPKPPADPNKESSSFIGDPENLDPLRSRQDNLKDDNEPVLEDIRAVIDAPEKPKIPADQGLDKTVELGQGKKISAKKTTVKKIASKRKKNAVRHTVRHKVESDENIEKRFHQNYLNYNELPTSVEVWSTATFGRSAEVYIVQKGDTLWTISETLFGDPLFWPKIWAINKQGILNPHFITPGMRVNFFPGSIDDAPTLAVGELKNEVKDDLLGQNEGDKDDSYATAEEDKEIVDEGYNEDEALVQGAASELNASLDEALPVTPNPKGRRSKKAKLKVLNSKDRPTRLPPSLPVYRSSLYYGKSRRVEIIDLEEPEKIPIVYASDIILTDRLVLSDIKISFQGNVELRCNPGDLLENFEFVRLPTTAEYTILQPLDKVTPEKNLSLYPYRIVGVASVYDEKKIKIKECSSYLNRDQIFVPSGIINAIKTKKSSAEVATIIGGPTVYEQVNYAQAQYVYVNMGTLGFDQGQLFGIKSSKLDRVVGQIRILDRFGSYGLAIITEAANAIRAGDTIVSQ